MNLSDIGALCVTFWENIHQFFDLSDTSQQFLAWVGIEKDKLETTQEKSELRDKLADGIQTQKHVQKILRNTFLSVLVGQRFQSYQLVPSNRQVSAGIKIIDWWETEESLSAILKVRKDIGKSWLAAKAMNSICGNENIVAFWLDSKDWKGTQVYI